MKEVAEQLLKIGAVKITDPEHLFTWVSGIRSPIYCDNRLIMSYPGIRQLVAKEFANRIKEDYPEVEIIAGTATAGITHAAFTAHELNLPMVYVRSSSKAHGTKKLVEGHLPQGAKVVLIEDLLSTGKSSTAAVRALREEGAEVLGCLAVFNYGFDEVRRAFGDLVYESLTTYSEVLEIAVLEGSVPKEKLDILEAWRENPRIFTDEE